MSALTELHITDDEVAAAVQAVPRRRVRQPDGTWLEVDASHSGVAAVAARKLGITVIVESGGTQLIYEPIPAVTS